MQKPEPDNFLVAFNITLALAFLEGLIELYRAGIERGKREQLKKGRGL